MIILLLATYGLGAAEVLALRLAGSSWNLALTATSGSMSKSITLPLHVGDSGTKIWTSTDLGFVLQAGSLVLTGPSALRLSGSGRNLAPVGSQFAYQPLSGDGQIVARLTGFEGASVNNSSGGVAIFGSLDTAAPYVSLDIVAPLTTSNYMCSAITPSAVTLPPSPDRTHDAAHRESETT